VLSMFEDYLRTRLPEGSLLNNFERDPFENAHKRVLFLCDKYPEVQTAYDVVRECLQRYKATEISVGFSGGKDCTVVAFLYFAALQELRQKEGSTDVLPQNWLYITPDTGRPEVQRFIAESKTLYGARLDTVKAPFKEALRLSVERGLKAFIMGNRSCDPKGHTLEHFKGTDSDWSPAMRVFPILHWDYSQVWRFLRELYIPYCTLYDQGFSSLGERSAPNPKLAFVDERGVTRFRAAHLLADGAAERMGRA